MGFADFGSGFLSKISTGVTGANNISSPGGYSRGPHPIRVSAMDCVSSGFNFIVTLNEFTFGFKSVSGISISRSTSTITEGGVNDHGIIVSEPNTGSYTLNFSRGLIIRYPQIVDAAAISAAAMIPNPIARKSALIIANSVSPQAALEKGPALGFINVYDRYNKKLLGLYSFLSLGMTEWRISDLDAGDGSLLIEDMTIIHTGITREPTALQPFSISSALNSESDVDRQAREAYEKIEKAKEEAGYYNETYEEKVDRIKNEMKEVKDKIAKMKTLVEQKEDPTDADLGGFNENEKHYIMQARLQRATRKTKAEINEADKAQDELNKEHAQKALEEREEKKEAREAAKEKADAAKAEEEKEMQKHIEQVKESRKKNEEARAKVTEANEAQDKQNKERAQKVLEERKAKEEASKN